MGRSPISGERGEPLREHREGDVLGWEILVLRAGPHGRWAFEGASGFRLEPPGEAARRETPRSARPLRILVVDDDEGCRQSVASLLSEDGHEILTASRGLEAVERVARISRVGEPLHASILDCNMPDLTGVETFRRLSRLVPGLQGAFMSADCTLELLEELRRVGGRLFIEKPLDVPRLRRALEVLYAPAGPC